MYYTFGARRVGEKSFGMIIINNKYHVHHWMYCFVILVALFASGNANPLLGGACLGGIIHGLQFHDWWQVRN